MLFFDSHRDATMRLEGTYIIYHGKAVYVRGIAEDLTLLVTRVCDGEEFVVDQRAEGVELRAPTLGYINTREGALYAMRKPARMWKQGLSTRSIAYRSNQGVRPRGPMGGVDAMALAKCFDNLYPTLEEAKRSFRNTNPFQQGRGPDSVAFSRQWAIGPNEQLFYKGKMVGKLGREPLLEEKYVWLAECLQECLDEKA